MSSDTNTCKFLHDRSRDRSRQSFESRKGKTRERQLELPLSVPCLTTQHNHLTNSLVQAPTMPEEKKTSYGTSTVDSTGNSTVCLPHILIDLYIYLVRLGSSGLKISRIILGCMSYGSPEWLKWVLPEEESIKHIKAA